MAKFHSGIVWLIGGDAKTYGLPDSFARSQREVIRFLKSLGEVCWNGQAMVRELSPFKHVKEDGRLDS